jgi:hypothetical protein
MPLLNNRKLFLVAVSGAWCLFSIAIAHAAPLTFATAESVTLSSPATTLTIATGSLADALQINATSVLVTLSQTTGGSFIILSPSYDLAVATSSGGGSATLSCSGGIETATLSQSTGSTVYTVTPSGTNCASASPPVIIAITATNITTNNATITWTTNIAADSTVSYGTTSSYGATSTDPTLVTAHGISLSSLTASTVYHYAVTSAAYGTSTTSGDNTFTTTAATSGGAGGSVGVGGGGSAYNLSIDSGAATSTTSSATLSLYGTMAYTMEIANTSDFAGAMWEPYATGIPWVLTPGVGTKTVYARFRSIGGGDLGTVSATIQLVPETGISSTTLALQAQIAALQVQLQALLAQVRNGGTGNTSASSGFIFTRDLSLWDTGTDVQALQTLLVDQNAGPAARVLAKHGTTKTFGLLTYNALRQFQKSVHISATGYFGSITRAYVAGL